MNDGRKVKKIWRMTSAKKIKRGKPARTWNVEIDWRQAVRIALTENILALGILAP